MAEPVDPNVIAKRPKSDVELSEETDKEPFTFSDEPNMEQIRKVQKAFVKERDWNQYHTPRNLLLALVGEVGEVSELFQWKGEVKDGLPGWSEKERTDLSHELADVFIYLMMLSEKCCIDLPKAVLEKIERNKGKYPAHLAYGSCKKHTEYATTTE